jgi:hypothetical protein
MSRPRATWQATSVIRGKAANQSQPTELILANSSSSGQPIRVNTNRKFLARAIQLGFDRLYIYDPKTPVLCQDDHRHYVWAVLDAESAIGPADDATRIASPLADGQPTPSQPKSRRRRTRMPRSRNGASGPAEPREAPQADNGKPQRPANRDLMAQAKAVRQSLQEALSRTNDLILALKRQEKRHRIVQSTLASLRQLQGIGIDT